VLIHVDFYLLVVVGIPPLRRDRSDLTGDERHPARKTQRKTQISSGIGLRMKQSLSFSSLSLVVRATRSMQPGPGKRPRLGGGDAGRREPSGAEPPTTVAL
jgi:hypothetical protein